jgi:biotin carboxyl carrier protein
VEAPLPGTVVAVRVAPGQEVKAGEVLVILEAMKMQNEIVSPRGGKVAAVTVKKGDTVALGDLLAVVE